MRPGALDLRAVNSLLYGLQTAAFNSKRTSFDSYGTRRETVSDDPIVSEREDRQAAEVAAGPELQPEPDPQWGEKKPPLPAQKG